MKGHHYTIRVAGRLDSSWSDWFEGLTVRYEADRGDAPPGGVTALSGWMDQAALHGTLAKIRDLGLPLLSVTRQERDAGCSSS